MSTAMSLPILAFMVMPVAAADDAEFAFNLLSDIAPILALFGDQFAKQFTSESLTWVDHLIFAMVPLGIITAITGALRVQGMPIAKAFIGRARENRAQAEIELMSSTSGEVCEIFNGNSIVRAMGNPEIAQFLIFPNQYGQCENNWKEFDRMVDPNPPKHDPEKVSCGIHSLQTAQEQGHLRCQEYLGRSAEFIQTRIQNLKRQLRKLYASPSSTPKKPQRTDKNEPKDLETAVEEKTEESEETAKDKFEKPRSLPPRADRAYRSPPNIQLNNTSDHFDSRWIKKHHEIFLAAVTGVLIQTGLIAIAAIVAYRVSPNSSDIFESKVYGFPCYAAGSLLLSIGTGLCSFIVEWSTDEYSWKAQVSGEAISEDNAPRLLWLQNKQRVNDQSFNGYIIAVGPKRRIVTSSRNDKPERHRKRDKSKPKVTRRSDNEELLWEWLTVGAALSAALGFTAQFMGLRGLAFPCSIAQLGAIFAMALIRAAIRRRLGKPIEHIRAFQWYEIDFLAARIVFSKGPRSRYWVSQGDGKEVDPKECFEWKVITPDQRLENSHHFVQFEKNPGTQTTDEPADKTSKEPSGQSTDKNFTSPTSQHLLRVRRRLGDLSRWKTRSSPSALALVQSIELVMNEFFPASSSRKLESLNWLLRAGNSDITGSQDTIQFRIAPKKKEGKFEVDLGLIDAAMSLWMASVDAKKPQNTSEEEKKNKRVTDWRRERTGDSLIYDYYRIIGNNLKDDVLKRDISWWVDNLTAKMSEPQPSEKSRSSKDEKRKEDAEIVIGFNGFERDNVQDNHIDGEKKELGVRSEDSLPVILAQHMFTSFMWTVAQHLPEGCLQPKDEDAQKEIEMNRHQVFESHDLDQTWLKLKLNHQRLDGLIRKMETYGMGDRKNILLCMIPALSSHKLLPNQVVLKLVPQMNQSSGWLEIANCHRTLLATIKADKMSIDDKLDVGIVTATMDFLSFACEDYDEHSAPSPELDAALRLVVEDLASAKFSEVLEKLKPVYLKQDRWDVFSSIFKRFSDADSLKLSDDNPTAEIDYDFARKTLEFTRSHVKACRSAEPTFYVREEAYRNVKDQEPLTRSKDIFGWTAYHYECVAEFSRLPSYWEKKAEQICRSRCKYSRSPLDIACLLGRDAKIEEILDYLSSEDQKLAMQGCGIDGMTPLHLIAKRGRLSSLKLVARKIDLLPFLSKKDFWGRQPLHVAARLAQEEVALKLLELGSLSNTLDDIGKSSVDYYLESERRKFAGAVPPEDGAVCDTTQNSKDGNKAKSFYLDRETSSILLRFSRKDPNCRYTHGRTFLHIAIEVADKCSIQTLLEDGFHTDAKDDDGRTPLHYSIIARREDIATSLIKGEALVEGQRESFRSNALLKDNRNITTLMLLAQLNLLKVAEALLDAVELRSIDEVDDDRKSAFHHATSLEMVKFLVSREANTTIKDSYGRTRLQMALEEPNEEIASHLLHLEEPEKVQKDPYDDDQNSLLLTACANGLSELIPAILDRWDYILDAGDRTYDQSPLAWACEKGYKDVVKALIARGADVNKPATGWSNLRPLHICAMQEHFEVLNLLIENDLERYPAPSKEDKGLLKLEERSGSDRTPLEMCIDNRSPDEECTKAIRTLFLHHRISASERLRCLKMIVQACRSDEDSNLKPILQEGFRKIIEEDIIQDFLLWLVTKRPSIATDTDTDTDTDVEEDDEECDVYALALLKPLVEVLQKGGFDLPDLYALVTALSHKEIREIIKSRIIDEHQGKDIDGWSCATYIDRYDTNGSLRDLATEIRKRLPTEQPNSAPQAQWHCDSKNVWENVKMTGAEISEFTVTKKSDVDSWACVRTTHCIPLSADHYYFEIEIFDDPGSGVVVLGFCGFDTGEDRLPGWVAKSWAYHGDDGKLVVDGEEAEDPNESFGANGTYSEGAIVGVYLDTKTGEGFCTRDGKKLEIGNVLDKAKEKFTVGKMYPCVGFGLDPDDVGLRFRVNLISTGKYPFKYQFPKE